MSHSCRIYFVFVSHFRILRFPCVCGGSLCFIAVPDGPGLGVTVDVEKLRQLAATPRPKQRPFLVRIRYRNGPTIITRHRPDIDGHTDDMRYLKRLLGRDVPGPTPGYINDVRTEWWDDSDDPAFRKAWQATKNRKYVLEHE